MTSKQISEIESAVVENCINMACLNGDGKLGMITLKVLDANVARLITARAKYMQMKTSEYMEWRRKALTEKV